MSFCSGIHIIPEPLDQECQVDKKGIKVGTVPGLSKNTILTFPYLSFSPEALLVNMDASYTSTIRANLTVLEKFPKSVVCGVVKSLCIEPISLILPLYNTKM